MHIRKSLVKTGLLCKWNIYQGNYSFPKPNQTKPRHRSDGDHPYTAHSSSSVAILSHRVRFIWKPEAQKSILQQEKGNVFYFPFEVHKIVCIPGIRNAVSKAHSVDAPHSKAGVGCPARCFPYSLSTCTAQVQTQAAMLAELSQLCHTVVKQRDLS